MLVEKNAPFPYWFFVLLLAAIGVSLWAWVSYIERQRQQAVANCLSSQVHAQPELQGDPDKIEEIATLCNTQCIRGELTGCQ
ncbi:MAG: hypothetical protein J7641_12415 [Cyanobacteria bacterium SID2]|nr:hypothetical protein [Cyanobacteria bacterium SID2]MBP0003203.1 hypothetical protein [Cyanobacteria bacterium SBC]